MKLHLYKIFSFLFLLAYISITNCYAASEIQINSKADSNSYSIIISGIDPSKANVFEVDNPNRLVIDLPHNKQVLKKGTFIKNSYIHKLRIGKHPDKTRIVVDLAEPKPTHVKSDDKNSISIRFTGTNNDSIVKDQILYEVTPAITPNSKEKYAALISTPSPTAAAPDTPTNIPTALPLLTPSSLPTNTYTPINTLAAITTPMTVEDVTGQRITGIKFKKDSEGPLTEIALIERTEFSLAKVKNRRFKLTIPKCVAGSKGLLLPHFPPNDVAGFTLIQVMPGVDSVDVFVGVDDGMKVSAASVGNSIVLRPVPAGF